MLAALATVFSSEIEDVVRSVFDDGDEDVAVVTQEDPSAVTPGPESSEPVRYVEADVGFPGTLNPLLASSSSERAVTTMLYRTLLSTDESGDPEPDLAVDWSVSDDGMTHTIELDSEAEWHDGEPISGADVLFTISLVRDAEFPGDRDLSQFWRAITPRQTGEHTIEFTLLEPYVGFAHYLKLPILPKHEFGDVLPADLDDVAFDEDVTGSGPYALAELDQQDGELRFVAQRDDGSVGFPEIVFRYYESREEAIDAFREGEVDGVSYVPLDALHDDAALPGNSQVYGPELAGYTALYFNVRHPYFRDTNTRRAIEAAIDRESIVDSVLGNHAIPGSSPIPRMSSAHQPGNHQEHSPEAARELFEREGWLVAEGDEVRQRDGEYFLIPLIVNSDDPQRIAVANLIQEQLREVGIAVDVQVMSSEDVQQALSSRQFTAVVFGWHTQNGNLDCFQMWHSSQGEDGRNFTGFVDANADELLLAARRSVSIDERNEHYRGFQEIFAEQVPAVVLFYPRYHFAVSESVQGAQPVPLVSPGDRVRQMPEWYGVESSAS